MHDNHRGNRLVPGTDSQDIGEQAEDAAGHRAVRGGLADGVVEEAVQRAHRLVALHQAASGRPVNASRIEAAVRKATESNRYELEQAVKKAVRHAHDDPPAG